MFNAAILAAGLGTRLRPLTLTRPKTLLPMLNRPMLGLWLDRLEAAGCGLAAVNTHHLAEQVHGFLASRGAAGPECRVVHEPELLGTGGGLRGLGQALGGGPFLAVNSDILTDLDLAAVFQAHRHGALATLVLHDCPPYNNVWLAEGRVAAIGPPPANPAGPPLAYTGVQVVAPEMLAFLPGQGPYDLVTAWREAIAAAGLVAAVVVSGLFWQDLGTPEAYLAAHRRLLAAPPPGLAPFLPASTDPLLGSDCDIGQGVAFGGGVCLGPGVRVGAGAALKNTVVWEGAIIAPHVTLTDCVVAAGVKVSRSSQGEILV